MNRKSILKYLLLFTFSITSFIFGVMFVSTLFSSFGNPTVRYIFGPLMFFIGTGIGSTLFYITCVEYWKKAKIINSIPKKLFLYIIIVVFSVAIGLILAILLIYIYEILRTIKGTYDLNVDWLYYLLNPFAFLFYWPNLLMKRFTEISFIFIPIIYCCIWVWIRYKRKNS